MITTFKAFYFNIKLLKNNKRFKSKLTNLH